MYLCLSVSAWAPILSNSSPSPRIKTRLWAEETGPDYYSVTPVPTYDEMVTWGRAVDAQMQSERNRQQGSHSPNGAGPGGRPFSSEEESQIDELERLLSLRRHAQKPLSASDAQSLRDALKGVDNMLAETSPSNAYALDAAGAAGVAVNGAEAPVNGAEAPVNGAEAPVNGAEATAGTVPPTDAFDDTNVSEGCSMYGCRETGGQGLEADAIASITYGDAGVDVEKGERFADWVGLEGASTARSGVPPEGSIGGFGGVFDLGAAGFTGGDSVLVGATDGVGTKLLLAQAARHHSGLGIDLVAMCVNDVLCQGAEPLFFLDYVAMGKLDLALGQEVVGGVIQGCKEAKCALLGGETAEMPDVYGETGYDLAGFAAGAVRRDAVLPHMDRMAEGDLLVAVQSSGLHSNGFSLVRKLLKEYLLDIQAPPPFASPCSTLAEALLVPSAIYSNALHPLPGKAGAVKGVAHVTGGGLPGNVPRMLPNHLQAILDLSSWSWPPVFKWLQQLSRLGTEEMLETFNCGVGLVLVVSPEQRDWEGVMRDLTNRGVVAWVCGTLEQKQLDDLGSGSDPIDTYGGRQSGVSLINAPSE
ncbi:unnamed protein product [Chrysoparadoxa australica]